MNDFSQNDDDASFNGLTVGNPTPSLWNLASEIAGLLLPGGRAKMTRTPNTVTTLDLSANSTLCKMMMMGSLLSPSSSSSPSLSRVESTAASQLRGADSPLSCPLDNAMSSPSVTLLPLDNLVESALQPPPWISIRKFKG